MKKFMTLAFAAMIALTLSMPADRKSTRLNSSHDQISYAVFCLKKKNDILTHCYSGAPNIGGQFTNILQGGTLLPTALAGKRQGGVFDVGHGGGSVDSNVAETAN